MKTYKTKKKSSDFCLITCNRSRASSLEQAYARRYPDDPRFTVSDFPAKKQDVEQLLAWVSTQAGANP
jgi:hypothetical protein